MSKLNKLTLTIFFITIFSVVALQTNAQEQEKGSPTAKMDKGSPMGEMDPKMAEMMEKWALYATPNENHRLLDTLVGDWDHTVTWWMEAGGEGEQSSGTTKTQWILDGRFLQQEVSGVSMGEPFAGLGLTGFDNLKQKYVNLWLDSMGTGVMVSEGTYDADTDTITDTGTYSCPMTGSERTYRAVMTFIDEDHYRYEMFTDDLKTGAEFKSMQIEYARK